MTRRNIYRGDRFNRDRRADSLAREVIGEAWRRHLNEQAKREEELDQAEAEAHEHIGTCEHCGSMYYDPQEQAWHERMECVGLGR